MSELGNLLKIFGLSRTYILMEKFKMKVEI